MARVRRARYLGLVFDDTPFFDLELLLQGKVERTTLRHVVALSVLTGREVELRPEELELMLATPAAEWVEPEDPEAADALARQGILLSDEDDEELVTLRRRHERLERVGWSRTAALFRFLSRWRQVDLRELTGEEDLSELAPRSEETMQMLIERYGRPPPASPTRPEGSSGLELPAVARDGQLYEVLRRRKTTRAFDVETALPLADLAAVLFHVFGYTGSAELGAGELGLRRTSPSGGALHPVEAYPLVINVETVEPGLYHYSGFDHALELVEPLAHDHAAALALRLVCGQTYFDGVHALVLLTGRFERAFWKYRNQPKALVAVWMDAAHLSQTLYLVATELGLGAFVTLAINDADADELLGLDGIGEGTLAACGVGNPAPEPSPVDPRFEPLVPRG
jgi:putative peptide maturation dehydrogenase